MFGGFLDKQPSNELTEEQTFSDWTTTKQFHYDTYNFLRHGSGRINLTWLDAATDLGETSFTAGVKMSFNIGNYYGGGGYNELSGTWEHYYRGIRKCNMIIERAADVPIAANSSEAEQNAEVTQIVAEARFLRAYFYWEMFLRYGPIPIVRTVLNPDGDLLTGYLQRPTLKEYVVDFVMAELKACEPDLRDVNREGYVCKPIASALYSRIALYMASPRFGTESGITWQDAADAAEVFKTAYGSDYSLFTISDATNSAYTYAILRTAHSDNNQEAIFFRNDGRVSWSFIVYDTPVGEGGMGGLCPSQNLIDMYDMADGSAPFTTYDETGAPVYNGLTPTINTASGYSDADMWTNRDPRLESTVLHQGSTWGNGTINVIRGQRDNPLGNAYSTPTGYYVAKYSPEGILDNNHTAYGFCNWQIIRFAEILLNEAEALNEIHGPTQQVYDNLNLIRHRAGITGNVEDRSDLTTKEAMRNFIRKERAVELCFEEHRWWDVRRWNVAKEALSRPIYGIDVAADGTITRKIAQERVFEERMYLYPIPEAEEWKTDIENNPGW
jgi:hypothetical protein